jgi:DNA-binding FrmR family transcriptional regulator
MTSNPGYVADKDELLTRLRKVEGQVRGLQRMVEDDSYCIDILTQVGSVCGALQSVAVRLLDDHLRHCVMDAAAAGSDGGADRKIGDATRAIERMLKL